MIETFDLAFQHPGGPWLHFPDISVPQGGTLLLQHLHERRGAGRPFQVAGFLCGALPSTAGNPLDEAWVQRLLAALPEAPEAASLLVKGSRFMRMERVVQALAEGARDAA